VRGSARHALHRSMDDRAAGAGGCEWNAEGQERAGRGELLPWRGVLEAAGCERVHGARAKLWHADLLAALACGAGTPISVLVNTDGSRLTLLKRALSQQRAL
jgi:hypothetical protein